MYDILLLLFALSPAVNAVKPIHQEVSPQPQARQGQDSKHKKSRMAGSSDHQETQPDTQSKKDDHQQSADTGTYKVDIRSLPFPPPDPLFRVYVGITALTAFFSLCTLWLIRVQNIAFKAQLKLMQDDSRLEHRAWMKFEKVDFTIAPQNYINVLISFTNIGRTPARDFQAWMFLETVPVNAEPNLSYEKDRNVPARPVVPPHSPLVFPIAGDLVDDALYAIIMSGKLRVMFHGKITYRDIFEGQHWMTFCQEFDPNVGKFMIHEKHNEADY